MRSSKEVGAMYFDLPGSAISTCGRNLAPQVIMSQPTKRKRDAPLQRAIRIAEFERLRRKLIHGPQDSAATKDEMKATILVMVEAVVDRKLRYLKDGQALGVEIRVEVVNSDLSFRDEPTQDPRNSPEYAEWRTAVYERDGYACVDCGVRRNLQAHHIRAWAYDLDRRFDVSNGQTLCVACHEKQHPHLKVIRKSPATRKDNGS